MQAEFVGFSLAVAPGRACYVPLGHRVGAAAAFDFGEGELTQVPIAEALAVLKPLLEDPAVLKIGQNLKYDCLVLRAARHRSGAARRHHADVLRARRRPRAARHGRAVRAPSQARLHALHAGAGARAGRQEVRQDLRAGAARQGHRVCRRGCRRHAAPVDGAEAAAGGRAHDRPSTRRWSGRWCACWPTWSAPASRSTGAFSRG